MFRLQINASSSVIGVYSITLLLALSQTAATYMYTYMYGHLSEFMSLLVVSNLM